MTRSALRKVLCYLVLITILPHATGVGIAESSGTGAGPDFTVVANPGTLVGEPGAWAPTSITVNSQNGFDGTVALHSFQYYNVFPVVVSPLNITLVPGESANFSVSLYVSSYLVSGGTASCWFNATGGDFYHLVEVTVTVPSTPRFTLLPEGFGLDPFPTVDVHPGESKNATLALKSVNDFSGEIVLSIAKVQGSTGATFHLSPDKVTLDPGGSANSTLTVAALETAMFGGGLVQVNANATSGPIGSWVKLFFSIREHMTLSYDKTVAVGPGCQTPLRGPWSDQANSVPLDKILPLQLKTGPNGKQSSPNGTNQLCPSPAKPKNSMSRRSETAPSSTTSQAATPSTCSRFWE